MRVDGSRERSVGPPTREDPGEPVCEDVLYDLGRISRGEAPRKREPRSEDTHPEEGKTQEGTELSEGEQPAGRATDFQGEQDPEAGRAALRFRKEEEQSG